MHTRPHFGIGLIFRNPLPPFTLSIHFQIECPMTAECVSRSKQYRRLKTLDRWNPSSSTPAGWNPFSPP